jgi:hypothetical protein
MASQLITSKDWTHNARYANDILEYDDRCNELNGLKNIIEAKVGIELSNYILSMAKPRNCIFTPLISTTLTAQGKLSGVEFHEEDLFTVFKLSGRIQRFKCNFGDKCSPDYVEKKKKIKTSNRGRKKKEKLFNTRVNQGSGDCFSSQGTIYVKSIPPVDLDPTFVDKTYLIKTFRNGALAVPGGLKIDLSDVNDAINTIIPELSSSLGSEVRLVELFSTMRNYKFKLFDDRLRSNIFKLNNIFIKANNLKKPYMANVSQIKYNIERYPGLTIKFNTPIARNEKKKTTIKLFYSGKVNIDGAISHESAIYYYNWINNLYLEMEEEFIFIPRTE